MIGEQPPAPTEKPTSGLAMTFKVLSALMLLLLGTCSVALDVHKVVWYAVFPYTYYMEIKTDLTVDGEAVQLSGVAQCDWDQRAGPFLVVPNRSGFRQRGGILAKRLPSGEAVVALVSVRCGARGDPSGLGGAKKGFWKTARPLDAPAGYLPIQTLLLDDADEPTRIEWSRSKEYFADSRTRVKYLGGTYLPKRWARRTDPREEFPWLRVERGSLEFWTGFFARVTSRDVWSHWGGWEAVLESLTDVTTMTGDLHLPSNAFHESHITLRPLFLEDGYWDYRPDETDPDGMVMLYPRKDPATGEFIPRGRWDNLFGAQSRLSVAGRPAGVSPPIYGRALYEPESKTLLSVHDTGISVSADEVMAKLPYKF